MNVKKKILALCIGMIACSAAQAAGVLDKNFPPGGAIFPDRGSYVEQQMVPGMSGLLTGIKLWGVGPMELKIAYGAIPSAGPWLVDITGITPSRLSGEAFVDLSTYSILVTAGSPMTLHLTGVRDTTMWFGTFYGGAPSPAGPSNYEGRLLTSWSVAYADYVGAVPEPETYAMMLAGLGVLGAVGRRRKTT